MNNPIFNRPGNVSPHAVEEAAKGLVTVLNALVSGQPQNLKAVAEMELGNTAVKNNIPGGASSAP